MADKISNSFEYDFVTDVIKKFYRDADVEKLLQRSYFLYFDETNNVRKVGVKTKDDKKYLNIADLTEHFVLGGVAFKDLREPLSIDELKAIIGIGAGQQMEEIKSKNVYSGDFKESLSSDRLGRILDYVLDREIYVHFESLNILYFCIADIVDSFVWNSLQPEIFFTQFYSIKDGFYEIFRLHQEENLQMLVDFGFPDIQPEKLPEFKQCLVNITERYMHETGDDGLIIKFLLSLFKTSILMRNVFRIVPDEESGVYLKNFFSFYTNRIATFQNSTIYLDHERYVEKHLATHENMRNNFHFIDSKSNTWIQLSDIMMGIVRKYMDFLDKDIKDIYHEISVLPENAIENLRKLNTIIIRSAEENYLFVQHVDRISIQEKLRIVGDKYRN